MTDDTDIGLGSYNGGQVSRPRQVFEMMLRKQLRQQIEREATLMSSVRAMDIKLGRAASKVLQTEMLRRIEQRGHCPAPATIIEEALRVYMR